MNSNTRVPQECSRVQALLCCCKQRLTLRMFCKIYLACLTWESSINRLARRVVCCWEGIPLFAITHTKASVTTLSRWCSFLLLSGSSADKGNMPSQRRERNTPHEEEESYDCGFSSEITFLRIREVPFPNSPSPSTIQTTLHLLHQASTYTPLSKSDIYINCILNNSPRSSQDKRVEHRLFSLTEPDALRACALHSPGFFLLNHSVLCSLVSTMNYSIMLALIPSCWKQNKTKLSSSVIS